MTTTAQPHAAQSRAAQPHAAQSRAADRSTLALDVDAAVTDALRRAARLDALLGDPYDPANAHGFAAFVGAALDRRPAWATERLLAEAGFAAEFVPSGHGGTLTRADLLLKVLRPVFRRDVALGFAAGLTSLFAASAVWAAGSAEQQHAISRLLLSGGRATVVRPGLAPEGGARRGQITARRRADGRGLLLGGGEAVVPDAARADVFLVHARTADTGARTHSALLVDPARRPAGRVHRLPRVATEGMRGALFSGLAFAECPVPDDTLVGAPGEGAALALRVNQVNRCLVAGAMTAALDPVLRSAVDAATDGRRGPPADRWHRPLAGVFADLLVCDAVTTTCLRAAGALPGRASAPTAAATYVVSTLLQDGLEELSAVLGSHRRPADDPLHGILAKLVRDLPAAGLGREGAAACQAVIVPQLGGLARHSWFAEEEPPTALFRAHAQLPLLDYRALTFPGNGDFLAASLPGAAERLSRPGRGGGRTTLLARMAQAFSSELRLLRDQCARLPGDPGAPDGPGQAPPGQALPRKPGQSLAGPVARGLSDRYGLVVAAAAVLAVREGQEGDDSFLAGDDWAVLALSRLGHRLGLALPGLPRDCVTGVLDELLRRHRTGRGLDLDGIALAPGARQEPYR
ncbi:acyl-CoA dehydrogenase [Streptomyces sp. NPDC007984]|uniref:acyl-CoA dehydrogenase n=1 Tax=Streptomyces sp. NPDC007984 TaxID=3364801 RepID=UPI0036E572DB